MTKNPLFTKPKTPTKNTQIQIICVFCYTFAHFPEGSAKTTYFCVSTLIYAAKTCQKQ